MTGLPYYLPALLPGGEPTFVPPVESWGPLEWNSEHCSEALDRLLEQFKEKQRIEDFLCVLIDQVQGIENASWELYVVRNLALAEGALLDQLGRLVGEDRRDRTDDVYRRFIGVRILSNRSDGQIEDLNEIVRAMFGGSFLGGFSEFYPATLLLQIDQAIDANTPAEEIGLVLHRSKAAGVALSALYTYEAISDTLVCDDTSSPFTASGQWNGNTIDETGGVCGDVRRI